MQYIEVEPGVNLSRALGGRAITKAWVRDMMRRHPEWDWRMMSTGQYVNGGDAVRYDLTLDVQKLTRSGYFSHVAFINYQSDEAEEYGYKAVVS